MEKINTNEALISNHVFIFPFRWDIIGKEGFEKRTNLTDLNNLLKGSENVWKPYRPSSEVAHYNDRAYFHGFVHNSIFEQDANTQKENTAVVLTYNREEMQEKDYVITLLDKTEYRLKIDKIRLNCYQTGVATLSIHLLNYDKKHEWSDILNINEFGRRLFPPFLSESPKENTLEETHKAFLATSIQMGEIDISGNWECFRKVAETFHEICLPSDHTVKALLGNLFTSKKENFNRSDKIKIEPVLDDRMFVLSWYGDDKHSKNLIPPKKNGWKKIRTSPRAKPSWQYAQNDAVKINTTHADFDTFIRYTYVDTDFNTYQSDYMLEKVIENSIYERWANFGTFYGITRYSMVILTDRYYFNLEHTQQHLRTRYFELAQLCLVQRASMLRFSSETARLTSNTAINTKEADAIYLNYLNFVNDLYFREVTTQEQGIDLYTLLQQRMGLEHDIKSLENEMTELVNWLKLQQSERLTLVATWFLPASFIVGLLGINVIHWEAGDVEKNIPKDTNFFTLFTQFAFWEAIFFTIVVSFGLYYYFKKLKNK